MSAEFGHHYIAGTWTVEATNGVIEVENPSNGTIIGTAPRVCGSGRSGLVAVTSRNAFDWNVLLR